MGGDHDQRPEAASATHRGIGCKELERVGGLQLGSRQPPGAVAVAVGQRDGELRPAVAHAGERDVDRSPNRGAQAVEVDVQLVLGAPRV